MNELVFQDDQLTCTQEVSKTISFNGYEFDIYAESWILNREVIARVGQALSGFDISIVDDIRNTLVYFAENKSAHYTVKVCEYLNKYTKITKQCIFNEAGLVAFKREFSDKT